MSLSDEDLQAHRIALEKRRPLRLKRRVCIVPDHIDRRSPDIVKIRGEQVLREPLNALRRFEALRLRRRWRWSNQKVQVPGTLRSRASAQSRQQSEKQNEAEAHPKMIAHSRAATSAALLAAEAALQLGIR